MKKELKHAHYIEKLARAIDEALPYWEDSSARVKTRREQRAYWLKGVGTEFLRLTEDWFEDQKGR